MPSILRVTVHAARNLPVMDQRSKLADAYVDVTFGRSTRRTEVVRKSLNPEWNAKFRFEVSEDADLLVTPLVLQVLDRDYLADDAVGMVLLSLEPLLTPVWNDHVPVATNSHANASAVSHGRGGAVGVPASPSLGPTGHAEHGHAHAVTSSALGRRTLEGWFPLFDSLDGVRGELLVTVSIQLVGAGLEDAGSAHVGGVVEEGATEAGETPPPTTHASASLSGVSFFSLSRLDAALYPQQAVLGFVEELMVEEDPEYSMVDTFRTARKSNDHRAQLLTGLAYRIRKAVAAKVRAIGGNAVLGYEQHFDLEGDSGIVARAYGTAARVLPSVAGQIADITRGTRKLRQFQNGPDSASTRGWRHPRGGGYDLGHANVPETILEESELLMRSEGSVRGADAMGLPNARGSHIEDGAHDGVPDIALDTTPHLAPAAVPTVERDALTLGTSVRDHTEAATMRTAPSKARAEKSKARKNTVMVRYQPLLRHVLVKHLTASSDVQLLSITSIPPGTRVRIGGLVVVRSVKYLGRLQAKGEMPLAGPQHAHVT